LGNHTTLSKKGEPKTTYEKLQKIQSLGWGKPAAERHVQMTIFLPLTSKPGLTPTGEGNGCGMGMRGNAREESRGSGEAPSCGKASSGNQQVLVKWRVEATKKLGLPPSLASRL